MYTKKDEYDSAIIHYAEIALKGNNRSYFENLLVTNIKAKLGELKIIRETGQIVIHITNEDIDKLKNVLAKIPGIAYFSLAKKTELNAETIKKAALDFLKDKEFNTFKVDAVRHDKNAGIKSQELNCLLGDEIIKAYDKKVKMQNPDILLKIEMTTKNAYISYQDFPGVGGMPTQRNKKIVALLSGGFDSPVAAYLLMKRGCEVILTHFQNRNQMTSSVQDKIEKIAEQLSKFQLKTKLYIVPFDEIQKQIIANVNSTQRMLVYRKLMIKIASKIAETEKARFLVVGDSLSQVASQTIENLEAVYHNSEKMILSPLIGMDKTEIIIISRKIGTYDISALPYGDCCSYFVPKHPELRSSKIDLEKAMHELDTEKLINQAIKDTKIKEY